LNTKSRNFTGHATISLWKRKLVHKMQAIAVEAVTKSTFETSFSNYEAKQILTHERGQPFYMAICFVLLLCSKVRQPNGINFFMYEINLAFLLFSFLLFCFCMINVVHILMNTSSSDSIHSTLHDIYTILQFYKINFKSLNNNWDIVKLNVYAQMYFFIEKYEKVDGIVCAYLLKNIF